MSRTEPDPAPAGRPRLVLLTGLSGSGKSTAAKCFEDLGYYCVDNLPLPLLEEFLERPRELAPGHRHLAVVTDVRAPGFAERFPEILERAPAGTTLVFFEAPDEILLRRFSETRRPHPLAPRRPVTEGLRRERELLAGLRARADLVLDTGSLSVHDLRERIFSDFAPQPSDDRQPVLSLVSFGYKHGLPQGADLVFDVRFLPNPHFVEGLRELTGRDAAVRDYLEEGREFSDLAARIESFLLYLLPRYQRENRAYLSAAVGCTGGQHRSVAMVERLAEGLEKAGWRLQKSHRDL